MSHYSTLFTYKSLEYTYEFKKIIEETKILLPKTASIVIGFIIDMNYSMNQAI